MRITSRADSGNSHGWTVHAYRAEFDVRRSLGEELHDLIVWFRNSSPSMRGSVDCVLRDTVIHVAWTTQEELEALFYGVMLFWELHCGYFRTRPPEVQKAIAHFVGQPDVFKIYQEENDEQES